MKRILKFKSNEHSYFIEENDQATFSIDKCELKFDSLNFYEKIFKSFNTSQTLALQNEVVADDQKIGLYIFNWLKTIIDEICAVFYEGNVPQFDDPSELAIGILEEKRTIKLFDLKVCAGDGFYLTDDNILFTDFETSDPKADYALKISGKSMEPTISDGDIVLVSETPTLQNNEIGIFVVDGDAMCKRFLQIDNKISLTPDNNTFDTCEFNEHTTILIQGKVINYK